MRSRASYGPWALSWAPAPAGERWTATDTGWFPIPADKARDGGGNPRGAWSRNDAWPEDMAETGCHGHIPWGPPGGSRTARRSHHTPAGNQSWAFSLETPSGRKTSPCFHSRACLPGGMGHALEWTQRYARIRESSKHLLRANQGRPRSPGCKCLWELGWESPEARSWSS